MSMLFSSPKSPEAPPAPPTRDQAADLAEANRQKSIAAGQSSSPDTLLTGGKGDESKAPIKNKTLLGS